MESNLKRAVSCALCALLAAACGGDDDGGGGASQRLEIEGAWTSEYGDETITETHWGSAEIVSFDNDDNVAVTRNPDDDEFFPGKFSRLVWTEPDDGSFYYCIVAFGLDTLDDALESDAEGDAGDLEGEGCGGFPWTRLSAA